MKCPAFGVRSHSLDERDKPCEVISVWQLVFGGVASESQWMHAGGDLDAGWRLPPESSGPNPDLGPER